jgi:hypothetical protein
VGSQSPSGIPSQLLQDIFADLSSTSAVLQPVWGTLPASPMGPNFDLVATKTIMSAGASRLLLLLRLSAAEAGQIIYVLQSTMIDWGTLEYH